MEREVFGQDKNARDGECDCVREGDAGFAALDATEPFFGASPAQTFDGALPVSNRRTAIARLTKVLSPSPLKRPPPRPSWEPSRR